jgi:plastocyanin
MFRSVTLGLALAAGLLYVLPAHPTSATPEPTVHEVKMVDISATEFQFEPADITVKRGDVVRWIQTTAMPHNVEFREGPDGAVPGLETPIGPFMATPDETYEVVIDAAFQAGTTKYVCTPHEFMGMVGSITVSD